MLGDNFEKISSSNYYSKSFQDYKQKKEKTDITNPNDENSSYNKRISLKELESALKLCKGSYPGPDNINYEMLKNLPIQGKIMLLKLFNKILIEKSYPRNWSKAI